MFILVLRVFTWVVITTMTMNKIYDIILFVFVCLKTWWCWHFKITVVRTITQPIYNLLFIFSQRDGRNTTARKNKEKKNLIKHN